MAERENHEKGGTERRRAFPVFLLTLVLFLFAAEFFVKRIGAALVPFALAYIAAQLVRPAGIFLSHKCRVPEKMGCAVFAVLVCFGAMYVLTLMSGLLATQLWDVIGRLPEYAEDASVLFADLLDLLPFSTRSDSQLAKMVSGAISEAASSIGTAAASFLGGVVGAVPSGVFSVVVGVFSFIYLMADPLGAADSIKSLLPAAVSQKIVRIFYEVSGAVFMYLRTYLTIMLVTFLELSVGLTILGVKYALAVALIIAVIDVLPVLGCGCVMIPWAVWEFIYGEVRRGVGLLVLLGAIYLIRQALDSKLIGKMTGVHPFVALMCLYLGWHIGGVGGMILAPVALCAARQIQNSQGWEED